MDHDRALVILSGGQDSVTCLYYAMNQHKHVMAITFDYGQRHSIEIESAKKVASIAGVEHEVHKMQFPRNDALEAGSTADLSETVRGLPCSFVPGRNIFFLTAACAVAYQRGVDYVYTGVCQTDYSGSIDEEAHSKSFLNTKEAHR